MLHRAVEGVVLLAATLGRRIPVNIPLAEDEIALARMLQYWVFGGQGNVLNGDDTDFVCTMLHASSAPLTTGNLIVNEEVQFRDPIFWGYWSQRLRDTGVGSAYLELTKEIHFPGEGYPLGGTQDFLFDNGSADVLSARVDLYYDVVRVSKGAKLQVMEKTMFQFGDQNP